MESDLCNYYIVDFFSVGGGSNVRSTTMHLFFVLFMNEKKGVEWEGALSPCCAVLQTTRESTGVVNCEGTTQAGKL
jgi:hypothetical protein